MICRFQALSFIKRGLEVRDDLRYVHTELIPVTSVQVQVPLLFAECCSVVLKNVTVMESYGYGVLGHNMMAKLDHCLFHRNYWRRPAPSSIQHSNSNNSSLSEIKFPDGSALLSIHFYVHFILMLSCRKNTTGTLNILQSEFAHRRIQFQSSDPVFEAFVHGGGLRIEFEYGYLIDIDPESINPDAVNITVYNCTMYNNTASIGANMFLSVHMPLDNLITVHINKCKFF